MNKSTYRFLVVALLAVLVLFVITGQFKIVLQSGSEDNQSTIDTDSEDLGANTSLPHLTAASIGFDYNSRS